MYLLDSFGRNVQTREEMLAKYEDAKKWLEGKNIRVSASRFQKYIKIIERNSSEDINSDFSILWANAELHDLCDIHRHLSSTDSEGLIESLRWIVKGHELLSSEKNDGGSVHGRNFTFELYVAARLSRAGYEVSFDTDADINFLHDNRLFHVECKRVISENSLDSRIKEALEQVDSRCNSSTNDRGIIAISVSRVVDKAIRLSAKGTYANMREMQDSMRSFVERWSLFFRGHYSGRSDKAVGMIMHYKVPFRDDATGAASFLSRFAVIAFDSTHENATLATQFAKNLRVSVESNS